ncbi:MAG: cell division protein ZapA [Gammaproteobacteria bacterium]
MSPGPSEVSVTIMGKQYRIACPPGEEQALHEAAKQVTAKMREISGSGHVVGMDRIAVFAALNLAHELLSRDNESDSWVDRVSESLGEMRQSIDMALKERENA